MSRLSDCLQRALDELQIPAAHLERSASLPPMALTHIRKGSHPRNDRFDRLLQAIPGLAHRIELLIAYTLDDTPDSFREIIEAVLRLHLYEAAHSSRQLEDTAAAILREDTPRRPAHAATRAREVLEAMARRLDQGDTLLAEWLADTGELLAAPHLTSEDYTKE